jgi:hypothetical protein
MPRASQGVSSSDPITPDVVNVVAEERRWLLRVIGATLCTCASAVRVSLQDSRLERLPVTA